jgi:formylglycine-generating enzyme required for sulfatase activity
MAQGSGRRQPFLVCIAAAFATCGIACETGKNGDRIHTITSGIGLRMVPIPAGKFMMGSEGGSADERPVHFVTLTEPFHMGATEVTKGQWEAVMGSGSNNTDDADLPVTNVSWKQCMEFCVKLTEAAQAKGQMPDGIVYRLPTEAEWEYACRANSTTSFCFGDDPAELGDYAWFAQNSGGRKHPVASKKPNAWGLHDMHGNVYELCLDWYGPYSASDATDPTGPTRGTHRAVRHGSYCPGCGPDVCRSSSRSKTEPDYSSPTMGFRVVRAVPVRSN